MLKSKVRVNQSPVTSESDDDCIRPKDGMEDEILQEDLKVQKLLDEEQYEYYQELRRELHRTEENIDLLKRALEDQNKVRDELLNKLT